MTPYEKLEDAAKTVQFGVNPKVASAGQLIVAVWRNQRECLQWLSGQVVGGRGGWPNWQVQQIAGAAAAGRDWRALRDEFVAQREGNRSTSGRTR